MVPGLHARRIAIARSIVTPLLCLGQKPICEDSAGVMKCWENVLLVLKICSILLPMSRPTNVGYEVVSRNYMLILQHWAGSWIQIREGIYSS